MSILVKDKILTYHSCETCLGWVGVVGSDAGLKKVILPLKSESAVLEQIVGYGCRIEIHDSGSLVDLTDRIKRYFEGQPVEFSDKLDLADATDFEQAVWRAVGKIPRGQTRSYGWVATELGLPKAARAVGQAVGRNPVPIIIPCHRVIRREGIIGSYHWGTERKQALLGWEWARTASHSD